MSVLIHTPVWSYAYRRSRRSLAEQRVVDELGELIRQQQASLIGPVRQEVLSGFSRSRQFIELRDTLRAFDDLELETSDYEVAAEFYNLFRRKRITGSPIDLLICATALRHNASIFTTDGDFHRYARLTGVQLHLLPAG